MSQTLGQQALSRCGKPLNVNDLCTLSGQVTAVSGSGPTALLTITTDGSATVLSNVQAQDTRALKFATQSYTPPTANAGGTGLPFNSSPATDSNGKYPGATFAGTIASITNYGPTATVVVTLVNSGNIITVQAQDIAASAQTV